MKNVLILLLLPFCAIAQISTFNKAENLFNQNKFDQAQPLFQEYLETHPENEKTREYLGDIASYNKNWDTAIDFYENLSQENEKNANYHFKYGGALGMKALAISRIRALTYIGDIKEQFTTAAELDPNHIETRWALIELYLQLPGILGGSTSKAEKYAEELQKISAVDGYLSKGYIEEYNNNEKAAEKYYKQAIGIGGSPHTYEKLTSLYEKNNQPEAAIKNAEKSLELHQRNQLNYQIGKIAAEYDMEPQLGIACLKSYIENHSYKDGVPTHWAYYRLAQIYRNLGDKKQALECIDKAIATSSNFEEAIAIRADIRDL
ncbi:MAG TPA: tetratricopeptide repeat protein [Leeuwenhoekiella sp.]|nr:tetratricopeptide repeat protein [Leeuwenhoekiella sp.]